MHLGAKDGQTARASLWGPDSESRLPDIERLLGKPACGDCLHRKTLEGICSAHGVKSGTLAAELQKLKEKGIIESRLFEWAEELRTMGNEAAQGLFQDRQRALAKGLGFGVLALGTAMGRQVVETRGHVGILRPQGLFHNRQRALIKRLGLCILASVRSRHGGAAFVAAHDHLQEDFAAL